MNNSTKAKTANTITGTIKKATGSNFSPEKLIGNKKLLLTAMFTGVAATLVSWAFRKNR